MNTRQTVVLGLAVLLLAHCSGSVRRSGGEEGGGITSEGGTTSQGGSGGTTVTTTPTTSLPTTTTTTTATTSTSPCRTCAEYVSDASDQNTLVPTGDPLCAGSDAIWSILLECGCSMCSAECPADACPGGTGSDWDACGPCLTGGFTGACSPALATCVNDA